MSNLKRYFLILCGLILFVAPVSAQRTQYRQQLAAQVRAEFLHAWNGYKKYAWGHDDLRPLSKTYQKRFSVPIMIGLSERPQIVVSPRIFLVAIPGMQKFGADLGCELRSGNWFLGEDTWRSDCADQ